MKAKKISMTISAFLFVAGLISAFVLSCRGLVGGDMGQLWLNLSIGLATGGLVALLIEFPLTYSIVGGNKHLLIANGFYVYAHAATLVALIDDACENEDTPVYKHFCKSALGKINNFALPMLRIDRHMFSCRSKRKQVDILIGELHNFIMNIDTVDSRLKIKLIELDMAVLERRIISEPLAEHSEHENTRSFKSRDVKAELIEIRSRILPLMNSINNTMNTTLSKKELERWHKDIAVANATINERTIAHKSK